MSNKVTQVDDNEYEDADAAYSGIMSIFDSQDKADKKQFCSTVLHTIGDFFHKENMPKKFFNLN